ncbi:DNA/RNA nuclease SfsA [Providencia burhodogranariea]|nr:DNA/RNA nuclease SfsA [Providencia burhodogranariea]
MPITEIPWSLFPPLQPATLIKRYKRFLADVMTPEGDVMTIHCANTGAMTGCATPGDKIWYSTSNNTKRKYPHSWEITQTLQNHLICINTLRANQVIAEALSQKHIPELSEYNIIKPEVKYGSENSRIDFFLSSCDLPDCFIEVKSVTLLEKNHGYFPDTVTERGQKHLRELTIIAKEGKKAILLFAVLHTGIFEVSAAAHIDKEYANLLDEAIENGVEVICYQIDITEKKLSLGKRIKFTSFK